MSEYKRPRGWRLIAHAGLCVGFVLATWAGLGAQKSPPIGGDTGNVAVEGTQKKLYAALHVLIVQTIDGVEHVIHFTKDLLVHGGKGQGVDALEGLEPGTTVVVHYTLVGTEETAQEIDRVGGERGLKATEGVLQRVDRRRRQVTIRFANGTTEILQLTERAASEVPSDLGSSASTDGTKVIVYYTDKAGHKVAHFFKKVS